MLSPININKRAAATQALFGNMSFKWDGCKLYSKSYQSNKIIIILLILVSTDLWGRGRVNTRTKIS